jgi:hypothetical protein
MQCIRRSETAGQGLDMRKHVPPEGRASARPVSRPRIAVSILLISLH